MRYLDKEEVISKIDYALRHTSGSFTQFKLLDFTITLQPNYTTKIRIEIHLYNTLVGEISGVMLRCNRIESVYFLLRNLWETSTTQENIRHVTNANKIKSLRDIPVLKTKWRGLRQKWKK
jgi:hypothetical protein